MRAFSLRNEKGRRTLDVVVDLFRFLCELPYMRERLKTSKPFVIAASVPGADYCTTFTSGIRVTATPVSRIMDTAGGGWMKHGGLHRLYGGHDISNLAYWRRFGLKFPRELAKDFITRNGLPYPRLQSAVTKGWVKASTAQRFGTWNVGKFAASSIGVLDTAFVVRKFSIDREYVGEHWRSKTFKGAVKLFTGTSTGNIPLALAGAVDLSLVAYAKVERQIQLEWHSQHYGAHLLQFGF